MSAKSPMDSLSFVQAQHFRVAPESRQSFPYPSLLVRARNGRIADNSPGTMRMLFPGRGSTVREVGALSDLDNISVRIADVAARLAVLGDRLRDELRSSTFP
jgi:hypothetical protein